MANDRGGKTLFRVETAVAADDKAIKALIRAVKINPMGIKWQRFLVARDESGRIVGCGQVKAHRDGSREVASIAVVPEWRQRGVAGALIARLLTDHPPPLWLTCISTLVPFYEQFGFRNVRDAAAMPRYFRRVYRLYNLFVRVAGQKGNLSVMVYKARSKT